MALELGEVDVYAMLRKIPMWKLREWEAYASMHPFPSSRLEALVGLICATIANSVRSSEKTPRAFRHTDFILEFDEKTFSDTQSEKQRWGLLKRLVTVNAGTKGESETLAKAQREVQAAAKKAAAERKRKPKAKS